MCVSICIHIYADFNSSGGLFWYGYNPKMFEMVSDRSSRAENWKDLRKISMRFFFNSQNVEK